jgi:hypothetical protein
MILFKDHTGFIKYLKKYYDEDKIIGAEIGVDDGENAENMIKELNIDELYLIDPYIECDKYGDADKRKITAFQRMIKHSTHCRFLYDRSAYAAIVVPDGLDFVYVDGDHSYDAVKSDIMLYYPKIKNDGIMGFDDFSPRCPGVAKAVLEFIEKYGLELLTGKSTDCWIIKKGVKGK